MTTIEIIGGAVAVIAAGAWLRWAVKPVVIGYRLGWRAGRRSGT